MTLRSILFVYRHKQACKRLQRDVEKRRASFENRDYVKRREAMLKVTRAMRLRRRRKAALKGMSLRQLSQGR